MHDRLPGGRFAAQLVMVADARGSGESGAFVEVHVDGLAVTVAAGASLLEACDAAGSYIPRLCFYPGLKCCACADSGGTECGLCAVRLDDGSTVLGCCTAAPGGRRVTTDDQELWAFRLERLAGILARHPHVCLTCPDGDGCTRDECTYGNPPEARCCDEFGRCELGKLVAYVDADLKLQRRAVSVERDAVTEGRIRREPGLCVACGRCVQICATSQAAGQVLELAPGPGGGEPAVERLVARPKQDTLRASGCTFCGLCVMVCPAGALTAPGEAGTQWLSGRRAKHGPVAAVLPPETHRMTIPDDLGAVPSASGLFRLIDRTGRVLRISGVADLRAGLDKALAEPASGEAAFFQIELDPLYTQRETELLARYVREHGQLPPGNDLGDDLFDDDISQP